jgi:hypothetical protein
MILEVCELGQQRGQSLSIGLTMPLGFLAPISHRQAVSSAFFSIFDRACRLPRSFTKVRAAPTGAVLVEN